MKTEKMWVLVRKEWSEVFRNKFVLFAVAFMPLLLTGLPLIIINSMGGADAGSLSLGEVTTQFAELCGEISTGACNQYVIVTQFMPMFLIMPVIIPITIASYSIVGEKTTRTLEPLLATPITTFELLGGKALAAVLPALLVTWAGFLVFVLGAILIGVHQEVVGKFFDPLWLLAIFLIGPLLALAAVSLAVMISSRTSEPRVAEQISGLLILPLVGVIVAQAAGVILLNAMLVLWFALFMAGLDAGLLYFAVQLFERESILTRWK